MYGYFSSMSYLPPCNIKPVERWEYWRVDTHMFLYLNPMSTASLDEVCFGIVGDVDRDFENIVLEMKLHK